MKFEIEKLVGGEETGSHSAVFREKTVPGSGPPLHLHTDQAEIFHVIRGRYRFVVDGVETVAEPGACLVVPKGAVHTFQHVDEEPGVLHYKMLPAGTSEEFFRKLVGGGV